MTTTWNPTHTDWTYDLYTNPLFPGVEIRKSALSETYRVRAGGQEHGSFDSLREAAGVAKHLS